MIAFDTDVLSDLISGRRPDYRQRASLVPAANQYAPVVAVGEVTRGQLNSIRLAEAGKGRVNLVVAYQLYQATCVELAKYTILPYTPAADLQFQQWKAAKIKVGTNDLRIAAVAVAHGVKLATRNARDFAQVPGLLLDVWN